MKGSNPGTALSLLILFFLFLRLIAAFMIPLGNDEVYGQWYSDISMVEEFTIQRGGHPVKKVALIKLDGWKGITD